MSNTEYLRFIKWDREYALFKKATLSDMIIGFIPLSGLLRILGINMPILIKTPKYMRDAKEDVIEQTKLKETE